MVVDMETHDTNEDTFCMVKCGRSRCVTCYNRLCLDNSFKNNVTGENMYLEFNGSCSTKMCVYIIKCKVPGCQMQYIGHTINHISARISQHKSTIIRGGGCKLLRDHFTLVHSIEDMSIMPIDILPEGLTLKEREEIEDDWILKCNTLYPYGLNARCKKVGIMDASIEVTNSRTTIYSKFPAVKISRGFRGGQLASDINPNLEFDPDMFLNSLLNDRITDLRATRTEICKLKKMNLKSLYIRTIKMINEKIEDDVRKIQICYFVKDMSWFYLSRMCKQRTKAKTSSFIVIDYCNKFVEFMNLKKIFGLPEVKKVSPFKRLYHSF